MLLFGNNRALVEYERPGWVAVLSVPTPDRYMPLLCVLGTRQAAEPVAFPVLGMVSESIPMLAIRGGGASGVIPSPPAGAVRSGFGRFGLGFMETGLPPHGKGARTRRVLRGSGPRRHRKPSHPGAMPEHESPDDRPAAMSAHHRPKLPRRTN
jgi:hypothetical protein